MPKDKTKAAAPIEELPLEKINTVFNSKLTDLENKVIRLIPNDDEQRITAREISDIVGVSVRAVYDIVYRSRLKGVPIVADRTQETAGLYIPLTNQARNRGMVSLRREYDEIGKALAGIAGADLDNWTREVGYEPQAI